MLYSLILDSDFKNFACKEYLKKLEEGKYDFGYLGKALELK